MTRASVRFRCRPGWLGVLLAGVLSAACAGGPTQIAVPAQLPNVTRDQQFTLRWALETTPQQVRAVGYVDTSLGQLPDMMLDLFGVDAGGRVVSRGLSRIPAPFTIGAVPFEVTLTPTGRETRYEIQVQSLEPFGPRSR